jgi:hypothetical protein
VRARFRSTSVKTSSALLGAGLSLAIAVALGAPNPTPSPVAVPGMVAFAGGHTRIGSEGGPPSESPPFMADVKPFSSTSIL